MPVLRGESGGRDSPASLFEVNFFHCLFQVFIKVSYMNEPRFSDRRVDSTAHNGFGISRFLIMLMAIACGVTVANLYYSQPLLEELSRFFQVSPTMIGSTVMLIQIGYALGMLFLVPLGDIRERRSLIIFMLFCSMVVLLGLSFAPGILWFLVGSFLVGVTSNAPHLIVPLAAHLAEPKARGRVIGMIMSGLLIGILASRTFSGVVGSALGWPAVYRMAAAMMALLILIFYIWLPKSVPNSTMSYGQLLKSMWGLLRDQPVLRESALVGAMIFGAFSVFWTTLSFLLKSPVYNLGAKTAGLFGLVGIVGALAASVTGVIADRRGPRFTLTIAITLSALSYVCLWLFGYHMWGLILGVIVLDLGVQTGQISNQARIHALADSVRNRNNAVYMVCFFCGGALGSVLGPFCWGHFGWPGVCALGLLLLSVAATAHVLGARRRAKAVRG